MGPLPAVGQWVRLEVPASQVGLENRTLTGMAFTLFNTIVTPNSTQDQWTHCSNVDSGALGVYSNVDSYHPGGVNILMADGSVRFIKDGINQRSWWSLGTKAGGEVVSADAYQ